MRSGIGFAVLMIGCSTSTDHQLPSAALTPHLDSRPTPVACGDDIALYGAATPDVRYGYTYDAQGRLAHADGTYAAGGANDSIDYSYDANDNFTHMLETHGFGDSRVEITADYDTSNSLLDYTWAVASADYTDTWSYAMSDFAGANQPTREVVTELGQAGFGYQLVYDATGRLTQAIPDTGDPTTYTYDDAALTITMDTGNGAFHGVYAYDDQDRELSEIWGGSDPSMVASTDVFAWNGDDLLSATYSSGTTAAPQTLGLVEVDTVRYDCASARAGRTTRVPRPTARPAAR